MKKKNELTKYGFSVAELLITMLVVMVVAAALVPVVGLKKVKDTRAKIRHGIMECYWEGGQLMQYYADNDERKNAIPQSVSGEYCTFNPPVADSFEVYVIDPGKGEYSDSIDAIRNKVYYYQNGVNNIISRGGLSVNGDRSFQSSIDKADKNYDIPAKLRMMFNAWKNHDNVNLKDSYGNRVLTDVPRARYWEIKGPVGAAGSAMTLYMQQTFDVTFNETSTKSCHELCMGERDCPGPYGHFDNIIDPWGPYSSDYYKMQNSNMCYYYMDIPGGDSGKPWTSNGNTVFDFDLDGNSDVNIKSTTENLTISTGLSTLSVPASSKGYDACWYGENINWAQRGHCISGGPCSNIANYDGKEASQPTMENVKASNNHAWILDESRISKGRSGAGDGSAYKKLKTVNGDPAKTGQYKVKRDPAFEWKYYGVMLGVNYVQAGTPGEVFYYMYPNLKNSLYLFPGRRTSSNLYTGSFMSRSTDKNDATKYLTSKSNDSQVSYLTQSLIDYPATPENVPFNPNGELVTNTKANNETLERVMEQINLSGYKSGLYDCGTVTACPGYALPGFYPLITNVNGDYKLQITDMQRDKDYSVQMSFGGDSTKYTSKCHDDADPISNTNSINVCSGTGSKSRGEGAIVIIW